MKRLIALVTLALCSLGLLGVASASAAPVWKLELHHNETHFPPGGEGQFWFETANVGDTATSGRPNSRSSCPKASPARR